MISISVESAHVLVAAARDRLAAIDRDALVVAIAEAAEALQRHEFGVALAKPVAVIAPVSGGTFIKWKKQPQVRTARKVARR